MLEAILIALFVPLVSGIVIACSLKNTEAKTASLAGLAGGIHASATAVIFGIWTSNHQHSFSYEFGSIFRSDAYSFPLSVFIDSVSILWLAMASLLSNVVIRFSRVYLHKDPGYHRFFSCLMFLIFGQTSLAVAGGLDTFMAGWEFVGICSFFLISFYHYRNMTVRNAYKVYSVYRFCDAGLLLGAWLSHILWHESQSFAVLRTSEIAVHLADVGQGSLLAMTGLILLAAAGKSAQFPFTFWLSRALEGPTPSSAIFYGALSVHAGLLLLLRTLPIWNASEWGPFLVGAIGLTTMIAASGIARAQSNIKGQIAYSSAAHVGLMFVELSLGFKSLAMLHMFGNASFRCYQLLVSPSSVAYLLRLQGSKSYRQSLKRKPIEHYFPKRLASILYIFALNDGFLEPLVRNTLWNPMTWVGKFIQKRARLFAAVMIPLTSVSLGMIASQSSGHHIDPALPIFLLAVCATGVTFLALSETRSSLRAWNAVGLSNCLAASAVWVHDPEIWQSILVFGSGVLIFWIIGLQALLFMQGHNRILDLREYQGLIKSHPGSALLLFIAVLGVSGFPISPTFVGQDMLLHHSVGDYVWLAFVLTLVFSVNGLATLRIYSKVCLGSQKL